jgi:hypothetical protein
MVLDSRPEDSLKRLTVSHITLNELDAGRQQLAPAVTQIVENDGVMPFFVKKGGDSTTDIPRTSGNHYFHKKHCPFASSLGNLKSITVVCGQTAGRASQCGFPHLPLTPRSHDANNHVTDEWREHLIHPFRGREQYWSVAVEGSKFPLSGALDSKWRWIIPITRWSRTATSSGCSLIRRHMRGQRSADRTQREFEKMLIPVVCMFGQSEPGLAIGYARTIDMGCKMKRATWKGKQEADARGTGTSNHSARPGFPPVNNDQFRAAGAA